MIIFTPRIIPLTLCTFLLSACGSINLNTDTKPQVVQVAPANQQTESSVPPSIYHPNAAASTPAAITEAYQSAQVAYHNGNYQQALELLENGPLATKSNLQFDAYLLAALSAAQLDDKSLSYRYISQAEQLPKASHPDKHNQLQETIASVLEHFENWLDVVKLRYELANYLPLDQGQYNQQQLWRGIQNLTQSQVDQLYQAQDPTLNAWLEVSNILRNANLSIEQQVTVYQRWAEQHPDHPAAITPPQDFQVMASITQMEPEKIVLLLPMTGPLKHASQAISDGFFSAYYHKTGHRPEVFLVNTQAYDKIEDALAVAYEYAPNVIIGPLQKNHVARLSYLDLPYPVIALNQLDINRQNHNLFHFSLSSEDDIKQLIVFAKQQGAENAAILSTQDTWALKQADEFAQAAAQEHITLTSNQSYGSSSKERQQAVQKLLLVDESYRRKQLIERWTGEQVESKTRSRKDLDYIFYVGKLSDAKQIRPLIDFYFADAIPMLASNTLHDSQPAKTDNSSDIERILFAEIPALANNASNLSNLPAHPGSNILRRLQALGADAYLLANRYPLFTQLPNTKMSANTGIISMDEMGIFHKRPEIMTYRKGRLVNVQDYDYFPQQEATPTGE